MFGRTSAALRVRSWRDVVAAGISDRRGIAAIEFALIAPLLLAMYFLTMEATHGIEANKKVSRVGSMVADLVTQQQTLTKADIDAIMNIGEATLQPYNRSRPTITVTAIEVTDDATPKVQVVWSRKLENGATSVGAAKGSETTIPSTLKTKGTFLIRVESSLEYEPIITWATMSAADKETMGVSAVFDGISMNESYHLRPRMTAIIPCTDC